MKSFLTVIPIVLLAACSSASNEGDAVEDDVRVSPQGAEAFVAKVCPVVRENTSGACLMDDPDIDTYRRAARDMYLLAPPPVQALLDTLQAMKINVHPNAKNDGWSTRSDIGIKGALIKSSQGFGAYYSGYEQGSFEGSVPGGVNRDYPSLVKGTGVDSPAAMLLWLVAHELAHVLTFSGGDVEKVLKGDYEAFTLRSREQLEERGVPTPLGELSKRLHCEGCEKLPAAEVHASFASIRASAYPTFFSMFNSEEDFCESFALYVMSQVAKNLTMHYPATDDEFDLLQRVRAPRNDFEKQRVTKLKAIYKLLPKMAFYRAPGCRRGDKRLDPESPSYDRLKPVGADAFVAKTCLVAKPSDEQCRRNDPSLERTKLAMRSMYALAPDRVKILLDHVPTYRVVDDPEEDPSSERLIRCPDSSGAVCIARNLLEGSRGLTEHLSLREQSLFEGAEQGQVNQAYPHFAPNAELDTPAAVALWMTLGQLPNFLDKSNLGGAYVARHAIAFYGSGPDPYPLLQGARDVYTRGESRVDQTQVISTFLELQASPHATIEASIRYRWFEASGESFAAYVMSKIARKLVLRMPHDGSDFDVFERFRNPRNPTERAYLDAMEAFYMELPLAVDLMTCGDACVCN